MIVSKRGLILKELEEGTGAAMGALVDQSGLRSGLRIWFADLDEKHGPVAELKLHGLKGHRVSLYFGNFSGSVVSQIRKASPEDIQLARALVESIRSEVEIDVIDQCFPEWTIMSGAFRMTATIRNLDDPLDNATVVATCRDIIVPMMAAMAELIGYDVIESPTDDASTAFEGTILRSAVKRRERNPRNRLLCIRIHGEKCMVCGLQPRQSYGEAGAIIEVHHLQPLASLEEPRSYDPCTDLVPLCPSCHRAVHTRHPIPISIKELREIMEACRG